MAGMEVLHLSDEKKRRHFSKYPCIQLLQNIQLLQRLWLHTGPEFTEQIKRPCSSLLAWLSWLLTVQQVWISSFQIHVTLQCPYLVFLYQIKVFFVQLIPHIAYRGSNNSSSFSFSPWKSLGFTLSLPSQPHPFSPCGLEQAFHSEWDGLVSVFLLRYDKHHLCCATYCVLY